jgi:hypothetical protein
VDSLKNINRAGGDKAGMGIVISGLALSGKERAPLPEDHCENRPLNLRMVECLTSASQLCGDCYQAGLRAVSPSPVDHMISSVFPPQGG